MFCSKCGKEISDDAVFCQFCGNQIVKQVDNQATVIVMDKQPKSQFIAIVLCIILGFVGIHDFYMDRYAAGIIKILILLFLGWVGIGFFIVGIWLLLDILIIAAKQDDCFYTKEELEQKRAEIKAYYDNVNKKKLN